jgi:hypothetical protein
VGKFIARAGGAFEFLLSMGSKNCVSRNGKIAVTEDQFAADEFPI